MPFSRIPSAWAIRCTGIPEIMETTSAICSLSTVSRFSFKLSSQRCFISSSSLINDFSRSRKLAASSKSCRRTASFLCVRASSIICSCCSISLGTVMFFRCTREPASSIASMALSGKLRSVMYLSVNLTHASRASSV